MRPLAIVDIDGVVADVRHRLHFIERTPKSWDKFFAAAVLDTSHPEGVAVVHQLAVEHDVVFLTGRPRNLERDTRKWLERHGLGGHRLLMRPQGDRRPAAQVKLEAIQRLAVTAPVAIVVDDDADVLATVAAAGFATFEANWEQRDAEDDAALRRAQGEEGRS